FGWDLLGCHGGACHPWARLGSARGARILQSIVVAVVAVDGRRRWIQIEDRFPEAIRELVYGVRRSRIMGHRDLLVAGRGWDFDCSQRTASGVGRAVLNR